MSNTHSTPSRKRRPWKHIVGYAATAVTFAGIGGAGGGTPATTAGPAPTVTETVTAPALAGASNPTPAKAPAKATPAAVTVEDGDWTVGEDVPAGTYKILPVLGADTTCYWQISKAGSTGLSGIVANDNPRGGHPKVTLRKGQAFKSMGCGTWTKVG